MNNIKAIGKRHFGTSNMSLKNDIFANRSNKTVKLKYNYYTQEEEYDKEFIGAHKNHKYTIPFQKFCFKPFELGWFNSYRDTDTGNARYNATAAYPNKLSNVLLRTEFLQSRTIMKLAMKFLDSRGVLYNQVAEPHPNITTNSVFLYSDPSNYINTRRGLERLFLFFILAKGLNFSGVLLYSFIITYLGLYVSLFFINSKDGFTHQEAWL